MRLKVVVLAVVWLAVSASASYADEFGGWKFKAPAGYKRAESGDHVTFVKITGTTFCQVALFSAHARGTDDAAFEWEFVVEKNFPTVDAKKPVTAKTKSLGYVATRADLKDASGNAFAATHYLLLPDGAAGSAMVTSTNASTLAKCPAKAFLDSIALASVPGAAATAPAPAAAEPVAADSIVGAWGGGAGNPARQAGSNSTMRRQYTFAANGTYTYFSELYDGTNLWIHVRESGTYAISGDQLTITPTASTISSRDWKAMKGTKKQALEKVTYRFSKHYFEGIQEWNLVLTPPKKTQRDGEFAANDQFKSSYLLSGSYKPEWKWP